MKKIILFLAVIILSISILTSCDIVGQIIGTPTPDIDNTVKCDHVDADDDYFCDKCGDTYFNDDKTDDEDSDNKPEDDDSDKQNYLYNAFTPAEKALFNQLIGEVIPFIPNNEYYVEEGFDPETYEVNCLCFSTYGNTADDFAAYREMFSSYTFIESYEDSDGDTWYCYEKGNIGIKMSLYNYDGESVVDVYAYIIDDSNTDNDDNGNTDSGDNSGYLYSSFTSDEKALFIEYFGEVIPFIANNEYYVEEYTYENEVGINFYTYGNTQTEFNAYKALYSSYTYDGTDTDEYGDAWYFYTANSGYYVDLSYYYYDGDYVVDVYVYFDSDYDNGDSGNGSGNGNGNDSDYLYTDFTSDEKALFIEYFGEVIPFFINNEYYVEEYTFDYDSGEYEKGINFYVYGATEAQFTLYRALYSNYTYEDTEKDYYGDSWYYYTADSGYYVDMCYYQDDEGRYVADIYVYFLYEGSVDDDGNGGNGDNGGNGGNGGTTTTPDNLITNEGAGLPTGNNGVYDVDFTDATNVKDVTDQGYYLDGCPTTDSPKVLVIPVDFTDIMGSKKGYSIDNILRAFTGGTGTTDYYSVQDYYYISSYGQLDLDITVVDEWFIPKNPSTYYADATYDYYGDQVMIGDQLVMDEALAYLSTIMDLSQFDSDGNAIIDAVVLITTLEIDDTTDFYWAYRYWNIYTDDDGYYYEYDGVSANDYLWASYSFIHESYDKEGNAYYTDTSVMNTYTYIHEMGHVLGADDYYDYSSRGDHPLDGCDIMDGMLGDHNAFTKFNLGWITTSRLVTTNSSVTLTLNAFSKSGDTIIIANNFDPTLGAYQEYYIVVYYTDDGLNGGEGAGYFAREGIVVYHINASLYSENDKGEIYYDIYYNNTDASDEYGTEENLIEFVKSSSDTFTYVAGDSLPTVTDDQGNKLSYGFTVDSINGDTATITFIKR